MCPKCGSDNTVVTYDDDGETIYCNGCGRTSVK